MNTPIRTLHHQVNSTPPELLRDPIITPQTYTGRICAIALIRPTRIASFFAILVVALRAGDVAGLFVGEPNVSLALWGKTPISTSVHSSTIKSEGAARALTGHLVPLLVRLSILTGSPQVCPPQGPSLHLQANRAYSPFLLSSHRPQPAPMHFSSHRFWARLTLGPRAGQIVAAGAEEVVGGAVAVGHTATPSRRRIPRVVFAGMESNLSFCRDS